MQRRLFIVSGVGAAAYAGMGTTAALAATALGGKGTVSVNAQGFASLLNESFNIYDGVRGITVQLVKVQKARDHAGQQFSLSFSGRSEDALASGTYEVEHGAVGKQMMYLDAQKRGAQSVVYRADFNLLG